ncbi:MAG: glycoside hydrolase family 65 protein [Bacteroidetes bacterium]|nr:glycoside hydrolase family 65 protein [Bacteroidota bacterium]
MSDFRITYTGWNPPEQKLREALCTLGNGYVSTRGAAEERCADEHNYPGTYLAGGYNRAKTEISGNIVENEDLVNFPNWLFLSFRPEHGEWLNLDLFTVLDYTQTLDMQHGLLLRSFKVEDGDGRRTSIESRRLVSMEHMHMAAIEWRLTPENWSGQIELRSALDGTVVNGGVDRYSDLEKLHLDPVCTEAIDDESILLKVKCRQSDLAVSLAASTRITEAAGQTDVTRETHEREKYIDQLLRFSVEEGGSYHIEKIVAIYSSRDRACAESSLEARKAVSRTGGFRELLSMQEAAYRKLWHRADITSTAGERHQQLLRLHIFHVLQTVSPNTIGLDVGVPARGWHGEAYRGHIFWDELFIFPFLNLRFPEISRSLLMYRYYRLDEARFAAEEAGYKGAMYPWQSGSNGREETQVLHLNPESGRWNPDITHLQRHVNSAIAYNIWNYYQATEDQLFLSYFGAEMFCEIAAFWGSKVEYNEERDRYEIHSVVGPDEYHTAYPDAEEGGLNNNAYTNVMAAWVLQKALLILDMIEESRRNELLTERSINDEQLALWKEASKKMFIPINEEGIIEQFEGYEQLKEFPWEEYREKYNDIMRLDRILESEGDTPNNYKASKQADVLMLFYLFNDDELRDIFTTLGYSFSVEMITRNIAYYRKRTSHGSTLSRLVFSWVLLKHDKQQSWQDFETLLSSDFEDIQGGTTHEGIHLGAMAGSLDLIQRNYAGLEVCEDVLWLKPDIPVHIDELFMRVQYRRHWISITISSKSIRVSFEEGWSNTVNIGVIDRVHEFRHGEEKEFPISR